MVFVDVADLLRRKRVVSMLLNPAEGNLVRIGEPNGLVVVLQKLALHAQNLDLVQLGDVVGHLVALLQTVLELVALDKLNIVAECAIVVLNAVAWVLDLQGSVKFDDDGLTDADARLEAGLHRLVQLGVLQALGRIVKGLAESVVS